MEAEENDIRKLIVYGDHFWEFYNDQRKKVQDRIDWVIRIIRTTRVIPAQYFKHLAGTEGLYEIRVQAGNDIFRIFCCFDEGSLIVFFSGFQKKTERTPSKEIEKALRLKNEYYENKEK